jgi:hypothetical protein
MVISSMAALFAVAMLIMSYTLSYRADEEEAATKLAAPADVKQNYQVQSETRTVRRHLQDLIENSIPIVEEKVHFPAEVTIYNLPQNVTKLRLDQDHLPQLQEVKSAEKTIMNNAEAEALEILNAVDNLPIGTSASIYRTDKSTGSIPAPVGGSRVDRALQKSQREESHS